MYYKPLWLLFLLREKSVYLFFCFRNRAIFSLLCIWKREQEFKLKCFWASVAVIVWVEHSFQKQRSPKLSLSLDWEIAWEIIWCHGASSEFRRGDDIQQSGMIRLSSLLEYNQLPLIRQAGVALISRNILIQFPDLRSTMVESRKIVRCNWYSTTLIQN